MRLCGGRVVGDQLFPAGLRVLVVDDDPTCLKVLERMLETCQYQVTTCDRAENALNELRTNKNGFDVVISDVHMPDMDGFKLLEHIGLEMDLPVIMMSADDGKNVVMKGVIHGACDYMIKPVRMEALKNIWQHVVRKKKNEWKDVEQSGRVEEGDSAQRLEDGEYSSPMSDGKSSKRKVDDEDAEDMDDDAATMKKARVVWSVELHQQFVAAVNQLGIDKAVPKKIMDLMNVPELSRENVASHLQKYRLYLRRLSGVSHHPGLLSFPYMSPRMSPFGGTDVQTLAVTGQLGGPTLSGYQPGLLRPNIKPGTSSVPFINQRNLFNLENPKSRFAEGQHLQQLGKTTSKQLNLLNGIPTTMDLKQVAGLHHQSAESLGSLSMQQTAHGSQTNSLLVPNVRSQTSLMRHSISSTGASTGLLARTGIADNSQAMSYRSASLPSSAIDFSVNHTPHMPCNSFPLGSTPTVTTSKGLIQTEVNSDVKGPSGFGPQYDMFPKLPQQPQKPQEWQSSSFSYGVLNHTSSTTNNIVVPPSVLMNNQGFSISPTPGLNGNSFAGNSTVVTTGTDVLQQGSSTQIINNALTENVSSRMNAERVQELSPANNLFPYQFDDDDDDDDLMTAFLNQQEGSGSAEAEFDFDVFTLDNIPV